MQSHRVVTEPEWIEARKQLLHKEKALTFMRDELSRERRELPWVKVDRNYEFDAPDGKVKLSDLFDGRSQLVVYHFMLGPGWEQGCQSCSWAADNLAPNVIHLNQRDVTFAAISRAPINEIEAFKRRMGWTFPWVSSFHNDFNFRFHVSFDPHQQEQGEVNYNYKLGRFPSTEAPGISVFYKDASSNIYHTYSTYARGLDPLLVGYFLLDLVPKGRDEEGLPYGMAWLRHHDRYPEREEVRT